MSLSVCLLAFAGVQCVFVCGGQRLFDSSLGCQIRQIPQLIKQSANSDLPHTPTHRPEKYVHPLAANNVPRPETLKLIFKKRINPFSLSEGL